MIKKRYKKSFTDSQTVFYLNSDGDKVTCFSSFEMVNNELLKLDINTKDMTINELLDKVSERLLKEYSIARKLNENFHKTEIALILKVLYMNIQEVAYYLYDFDCAKMPNYICESYRNQYLIER